jgi:hypothetical protein
MSLYSAKPVDVTIPEGCPWHHGQLEYGMPNVDWCEPTVCSLINEPANTWSNLPFLIVGFILWKKINNATVKAFGVVVFVMGFLSAVYHATNNLLTQHFDFVGMALMTSFLLAFVTRRILNVKSTIFDKYFWFYFSLNMLTLLFLGLLKLPVQMLLLLNSIPILLAEIYCFVKLKRTKRFSFFILSISILILAQVSAQVDLKRIYCDPQNILLHGHVVWHILCAIAMYFAGLFIRENSHPTV